MHQLAEICVRRPVFATMLILALTVVGVFSFFTLGVDLLPKVDLPTVMVSVSNPGASPEQIETEITKRIEGAVNTISGIDELRSSSVEGISQVIVTFALEKNGDVATQEVRDKINLVLPDLPETAKQPVVQKFDPDAAPIMRIVVAAPRSLRDVTHVAEKNIKEHIENIKGVGQVQIVGGARREIHVRVDPDRMRAYNLTVAEVTNALRQQNLEMPGGRVDEGSRELTVRTMGRITDPKAFNEIAITTRGSYVVRIRDIGYAEDSVEEPRSVSRLDGQTAVTLVVSKQSGENVVAVADAVKERLAEIAPTLAKDVHTEVISDQSIFINAAIGSIETHLIEGSILACVVIFFFLANVRTTLIAAIAIPTSIISTFALMAAMGYTLNQITMLALTLMVGIVIDDAIIVLENIYRFIEEKGMTPFEAAIEGTREIGLAVMATTFSLLAVFVPVGFMGGMVGRFMSSFGLTASFAIAVSLLVSFTLTPMLSARFIKQPEKSNGHSGVSSKESGFFRPIDAAYTHMLRWSMAHRMMIVGLSTVVVLSIVPLFMFIGKNFVPEDDRSEFEITVRAAEGATLASTGSVVERIARDMRQLPGVANTLTTIGGGSQGAVNSASIYVRLASLDERDLTQQELMVRARELLTNYPAELRTTVQKAGGSGTGGRSADVQYALSGPDLDKLYAYSKTLLDRLKTIPDVVDADTSLIIGKPELRIEVDRQRAADMGVSVGDISQTFNTLIAGQVVSTFDAGTDQYDVRLRSTREFRASPEGLKRVIVASSKKGWVGLGEVAGIKEGAGPSTIERLNRQRQVMLSANVLPGGSQAGVISQMDEFVQTAKLDPGYTSQLSGLSKELGRTGYYFVLAISLSFIFMYMVLAAQFESFIHPVTILLTLPLAIPFGIFSLLVLGQTVNIFSGLGLLLLFGIVKKNAILQIDHTNTLRHAGLERYDAIIQANRDRLRPILMTTVALVAGMTPLVISSGVGAATNRSIGVLVVGGQSLCLLLTLLAVPVFYSLFEDFKDLPVWQRLTRRYQAFSSALGPAPRGHRVGGDVSFPPQSQDCAIQGGQVTTVQQRNPARCVQVRSFAATVILLAAASFSNQAIAQQSLRTNTQKPIRPVVLLPRIGVLGEVALTLKEVIAQVLAANKDIEGSRIDQHIARLQLVGAKGRFDPVIGAQGSLQRQVSPVSSVIGGGASGKVEQRDSTMSPQINGLVPWLGGTYQVSLTSTRLTTDNPFVTLNPQFPTALTFNFNQPLFRNLLFDDNRRSIEVAKKNRSLSDEQFRRRVIDTVTQAEQAYWELVFAVRNLQVQTEAADLARRQVESNQRMVDQGILAPVDGCNALVQSVAPRFGSIRVLRTFSARVTDSCALSPRWPRSVAPRTIGKGWNNWSRPMCATPCRE